MPRPFVAPPPPQSNVVRYQDHIHSLSRSDKTAQRSLSQSTRVHVLRDKIEEPDAKALELLAQKLGAQVTSTPDAANVIVTVLRAPKRIAKHFGDADLNVFPSFAPTQPEEEDNGGKEIAERKLGDGIGKDWRRFVVTEEWLEAVKTEGTLVDPDLYPAVKLREDHNERFQKQPASATEKDQDETQSEPSIALKRKRSPSDSPLLPTHHTSKEPKLSAKPSGHSLSPSPQPPPDYYKPTSYPARVPRYQNSRFACRRPSPLFCPNQPLVLELEVIRNERRLTGDMYSEMAYMRAISALKAYPFRIPNPHLDPPSVFSSELLEMRLAEVEKLKGVGKKVFSLLKQFYKEGRIVEAKVIARDRAVFVMNAFAELYGIGPIGAREAYNSGARSFSDVLHRGKSLATHLTAKESVRILGDLRKPIGRAECQEITRDIIALVKSILGAGVEVKYEICGGYRRGKERTFDLDVIIGHDDPPSRALHMRLLDEMKKKGLVSHIVNVSTPAASHLEYSSTGTDAIHIDIANIVVLPHPSAAMPKPVHRRVDLVFCPLRVYGATVLGWTGSMTFERDLRLWAKSKGYNFSFDGLTNLAEETVVETRSEEEIFTLLGLEYMPPEWRNCDA